MRWGVYKAVYYGGHQVVLQYKQVEMGLAVNSSSGGDHITP